MQKSAIKYEQALALFSQALQAAGQRLTVPRRVILEKACALRSPFTAIQLWEACKSERIARATVYNVVDLCVTARIMQVVNRQRGQAGAEYEIITGAPTQQKLICMNCGRIATIHNKLFDRIISEYKFKNFEMVHYSLFVYGKCKKCRTTKTPIKQKI